MKKGDTLRCIRDIYNTFGNKIYQKDKLYIIDSFQTFGGTHFIYIKNGNIINAHSVDWAFNNFKKENLKVDKL